MTVSCYVPRRRIRGVAEDEILQPGETWIYTATDTLTKTTTNVGTATGVGADIVATDTATATVVVGAPADSGETTPATPAAPVGRVLPKTGTPWYGVLLAGFVLMVVGAGGWVAHKSRA